MKVFFACLTIVGGLFAYAVAETPSANEGAKTDTPAVIAPVTVPQTATPRLPEPTGTGNVTTVLPPVAPPAADSGSSSAPAAEVESVPNTSAEPALNTAQRGEVNDLLKAFVDSEEFDKTLDTKLATKVPAIVQEVAPGIVGPLVDQAVPGAVAKYMGEYKKEVSAAAAAQMVQSLENRGIISRSTTSTSPSASTATTTPPPATATGVVQQPARIVERPVAVPSGTVVSNPAPSYSPSYSPSTVVYPAPVPSGTVVSDYSQGEVFYPAPACSNPNGCSQSQHFQSYPQYSEPQYSQPQNNGGGRGGIFGLGVIGRRK